jgi:carboxypeptidase PM20D1
MDDKVGVMGILEAVEHLLAKGYEPQRTVYLAFGHDEEAGGQEGAGKIAALLRERQVEFEYILDEGGNITEGIIPGLPSPVALIGIAEKGYVSLELSTVASSGHTSTAPPQTAIGILSGAIARLEQARFAPRISLPTRRLLEFVGPEMAWPDKLVMANLWLFEKLVISRMTRSPLTDAAIRTTQAATIFQAGIQENILPARASAVVNFRVLTGETISPVVERARRVINDSRVTITPLPAHAEPSPVSEIESDGFRDIARSLRQIYPHILVAPFLMIAATDSRHFVPFTKNIFRFLPITLRPEDAARYHGIDERVSLKDYEAGVRFYIQLIKNSASKG